MEENEGNNVQKGNRSETALAIVSSKTHLGLDGIVSLYVSQNPTSIIASVLLISQHATQLHLSPPHLIHGFPRL